MSEIALYGKEPHPHVVEGEQVVLVAETDLPAPKRMRVDLAFDGTAAQGSTADYWVRISAIFIPAGETRGELAFTVVADEEVEGAETVVIDARVKTRPCRLSR